MVSLGVGTRAQKSSAPTSHITSQKNLEKGTSPSTASRKRTKRADIQALRALAVLAVVIYHLWPEAMPAGFVGVDIFFVISGFLITGQLFAQSRNSGSVGLLQFYARRIKRILPSAYVVLLVSLGAAVIWLPSDAVTTAAHDVITSVFYVQNVSLASQSIDYLAQDSTPSLFNHFWSLSAEEQFYIIVPLMLVLATLTTRWKKRSDLLLPVFASLLGVCALASFWYAQSGVRSGDPSVYYLITSRFWELALGALAAIFAIRVSNARHRTLVAGFGWAFLSWAIFFTDPTHFPGAGALPATLGALLVIVASSETTTNRLITAGPVQFVGNLSYSLYLTHWPIVVAAQLLVIERGVRADSIMVAISVSAACLLYFFVDRPLAHVAFPRRAQIIALVLGVAASALVVFAAIFLGRINDNNIQRSEQAVTALLSEHSQDIGGQALPEESYTDSEFEGAEYAAFIDGQSAIAPQPTMARAELPTGAKTGCKSEMGDATTPRCEYGNAAAPITIALAGDSHIEQYLPAFERIMEEHPEVRVVTYFHASCPLGFAVRSTDDKRGRPCIASNEETLQALIEDHSIDLVVTSNRTDVPFVENEESAEEGLARLWDELTTSGKRLIVLSDNPVMAPDDLTRYCVVAYSDAPERCAEPRSHALPVDRQLGAADIAQDVKLVDTTSWFCDLKQCPAVISNVLVYRDQQHLTVQYAQSLWKQVWAVVQPHLPAR